MHRTQITLTDEQYRQLRQESAEGGLSLAEIVRRSLDERYERISQAERLRLLDSAFGAWSERGESGAELVERVRTGSARRLAARR